MLRACVVKDINVGASGDCLEKYLHVRVAIDTTRPLKRCVRVALTDGAEETMLLVHYVSVYQKFASIVECWGICSRNVRLTKILQLLVCMI
ncbi:hypothetical protein JRO89_XS04G0095800 [Xanthoceras sorbifolium]|uniref:Uncharacterized protein n=1 Tax=Xanthoceras sorbifolium TaxID=99658 RepID=A0ABQ8I4W7_9ROSI|nr:hypothetical protein JRO89_XS04G0095800 [Xanthoceras sorbifolium]